VTEEIDSTVEFAASIATHAGQSPAADGCHDSQDELDELLGKPGAKGREHILQQDNGSGNFGLRAGDWKLVRLEKRGKSQARVSKDDVPLPAAKHTLYNLTDDPGERTDVSAAHPEVLQRLTTQLDKIIDAGRSRPASKP
jgi:arylsulfatase A